MGNFFTKDWFPLNIIITLVLAAIAVLIWGLVTNWGRGKPSPPGPPPPIPPTPPECDPNQTLIPCTKICCSSPRDPKVCCGGAVCCNTTWCLDPKTGGQAPRPSTKGNICCPPKKFCPKDPFWPCCPGDSKCTNDTCTLTCGPLQCNWDKGLECYQIGNVKLNTVYDPNTWDTQTQCFVPPGETKCVDVKSKSLTTTGTYYSCQKSNSQCEIDKGYSVRSIPHFEKSELNSSSAKTCFTDSQSPFCGLNSINHDSKKDISVNDSDWALQTLQADWDMCKQNASPSSCNKNEKCKWIENNFQVSEKEVEQLIEN